MKNAKPQNHSETPVSAPVRLQKYLSAAGVCSRRRGEAMIAAGRVSVNGQVVTQLGTKVVPGKDRIEVDGHPVRGGADRIYIALNKPAGYVTSCRQPKDLIVLDLVDIGERVYPVGRLDKESTGLLLLTNDGRLRDDFANLIRDPDAFLAAAGSFRSKITRRGEYVVSTCRRLVP